MLSILLAVAFSAEVPVVAEVKEYGGAPALWIDGRPDTGLMHWNRYMTPADVAVFRDAGVHLFSFMGAPDMPDPDGRPVDYSDGMIAKVPLLTPQSIDETMAMIVQADPKAKVLLRLRLTTPDWWRRRHPGEAVRVYDEGKKGGWSDRKWGAPSSESWRRLMEEAVRRTIRHCESAWPGRIIGYHPGLGACAENSYDSVKKGPYNPGGMLGDAPCNDPDTCWLNMFPRSISASGHSHRPFTDRELFRSGKFTAFGAGSYYLSGGPQQKGMREVSVMTIRPDGMVLERFGLHDGFRDVKTVDVQSPPAEDKCVDGSFVFAQWNVGGFKIANGGRLGSLRTHRRRNSGYDPAIDNVMVKGFDILGIWTADDAMILSDHRVLACRLKTI